MTHPLDDRIVPKLCPYAPSPSEIFSRMAQSPSFEITCHLRTGNAGQERTVIQATSLDTARRIFTQQNPGCIIDSARPLPSIR